MGPELAVVASNRVEDIQTLGMGHSWEHDYRVLELPVWRDDCEPDAGPNDEERD